MANNANNLIIAFRSSGKEKNKFLDDYNIINNPLYLRRMSGLVNDSVAKGSDVLHLPNGNVIVTETKVVTYHYIWNSEKGRFERAKSGSKSSRARKNGSKSDHNAGSDSEFNEFYGNFEDEEDCDDLVSEESKVKSTKKSKNKGDINELV